MDYFFFERDPRTCRASFALSHPGQINCKKESSAWLDRNHLDGYLPLGEPIPPDMARAIAEGRLRAVNQAHPRWHELVETRPAPKPWRLNLLGCGDVGATILIGLKLLAGDTIGQIGIYDLNCDLCRRWEFELNQVTGLDAGQKSPHIQIIDKDALFDCDIFVFCATAGVPPLEIEEDVRLFQYDRNAAILREYARAARKARFQGLFTVVSDPVDLLCRVALAESNRGERNEFDGQGLFPEQIEGYGLGVMHARAVYFARRDPRFASYLDEGRAYGPHGEGLVIANSLICYDDALSRELSELAAHANLQARAASFKPYVAPALSSAVLPILATIRGQWHYSSTCLGELYMGSRNRRTQAGLETEILSLPPLLKKRIEETAALLADWDAYRE